MEYLRLVFDNRQDAHTEWCNKPKGEVCPDEECLKPCKHMVRKEA
jgi:hypothetical protein